MLVTERFELNPLTKGVLRRKEPKFGFGLLGAATYFRTYSRLKEDGSQEKWADTVIRVVEGVFSIRKWWHVSHRLPWSDEDWQPVAIRMANAIFEMRFLPPGRGLWAMGSDYVYERGAAALYNCAYSDTTNLADDAAWTMDMLMCGVGTGAGLRSEGRGFEPLLNNGGHKQRYTIPDTREGWVESERLLIEAFHNGDADYEFDYGLIRPSGEPIRGFGGTASGPDPLRKLHDRTREYLTRAVNGEISNMRARVDVINAIGACVVAGNVRRSAEIMLGNPDDAEFLNLKNYELNPDRQEIGWMSNNTAVLSELSHFSRIPEIAERIRTNGEPGVLNLLNVQKYGRYGDEMIDLADGANPCSEIPLEHRETCNLAEVFPTRCKTTEEYYEALELATLYASTVSLLPTHDTSTNEVIARNRRIGVSLTGIADWFDNENASHIITLMRQGYKLVRSVNEHLAKEAGIPVSVRVTTTKPSGTVSLLAGVSPGVHYPVRNRYVRRMRVGQDAPIVPLLIEANVPNEPDKYSDSTLVFEFPVETKAKRGQRDITIWQKGALVQLIQKHFVDNMVSNTITFDPKTEGHQIEDFLAHMIPFTKSLSMLPDTDEGVYEQAPYEGIPKTEYDRRVKEIGTVDWTKFGGSDGQDVKFCENDSCEI